MNKELFKIKENAFFNYTVEKSKFISYSFIIDKDFNQKEILKKIRSEHHSASHICWAFRSGSDISVNGFNVIKGYEDDGEPSGTAGSQILNLLEENNVIDTFIVVVRYFGGIKLGVPGLSRAYKNSALHVIINNLKPIQIKSVCVCRCEYNVFDNVKKYAEANLCTLFDVTFTTFVTFKIVLNNLQIEQVKEKFDNFLQVEYSVLD